MLRFNLTRVFKARGIDHPFTFLVDAGYSASFATTAINKRTRSMDLKHIEKFCMIFHCTPNDLLEWVPDSHNTIDEKQSLTALIRSDKEVSLTQMIYSVPFDKLGVIEEMIKKEI
jgi:hypothetical protein